MAQWWDGVELWIAGLPFVPQVVLTLGVLIPLAGLAAAGLDRLVGLAIGTGRSDGASSGGRDASNGVPDGGSTDKERR